LPGFVETGDAALSGSLCADVLDPGRLAPIKCRTRDSTGIEVGSASHFAAAVYRERSSAYRTGQNAHDGQFVGGLRVGRTAQKSSYHESGDCQCE